jgi:hypothetical protein
MEISMQEMSEIKIVSLKQTIFSTTQRHFDCMIGRASVLICLEKSFIAFLARATILLQSKHAFNAKNT